MSRFRRFCLRPTTLILAIILVAGGWLRLFRLNEVPPGLNQDEAANAWNAFCLLKTGHDQVGAPWPIFYARTLGENRSTLFFYWLIPFQAVGGLNVWTTRFAGAAAGLGAVLCLYYLARRWFGVWVGLMAAALLTITPWAIHQSRWGHEATIVPLLICGALVAMLSAGLPLSDEPAFKPRPLRALLAGLLCGVVCYGYPAVRIFLPPFLALVALFVIDRIIVMLRTRAGTAVLLSFAAGFAVTFGPLLWQHIFNADNIARRANVGWVWDTNDGPVERARKMGLRYVDHFSLRFLFVEGEWSNAAKTPYGAMHWFVLPLAATGVLVAIGRSRRSIAARVALAWLIAYPLGDCLFQHPGVHLLRSLPGLCAPLVLAGLGAAWLWEVVSLHSRTMALAGLSIVSAIAGAETERFCSRYFHDFYRQPKVYGEYQVDLVQACAWLKPRFEGADYVFFTGRAKLPYIITLVCLGYDPRRWLTEPRDVDSSGDWDRYMRYGKVSFLNDRRLYKSVMAENGPRTPGKRVLVIARPGEVALPEVLPAESASDLSGQVVLLYYEFGR